MIPAKIFLISVFALGTISLSAQNWTVVDNEHIYHAGPVSIGTTSMASLEEGFLLNVDGKIICEEVFIQLAEFWADYVFLPDYRLLPLDDLPRYIEKHGHLPNMPSASEMEATGIELGPATGRLLEKIEELSLYLIEDFERDEAMRLEITRLATELEK